MPAVKVTEEDIREYYEENRERFREPNLIKFGMIEVKKEKEALDLRRELEAGAVFNRLIEGLNRSSEKRGGIAWKSEKELPVSIRGELVDLEIGEISRVIQAPSGYKILVLMNRKQGKVRDISDTREMIRRHLARERGESLLKTYRGKLREASLIEVNEDLLMSSEEKVKNGL